MLLPCPHCKKCFKLSIERITARAVKVKCPACKGHFVVDLSPLRRIPRPVSEPASPRPAPIRFPQDSRPSAPAGHENRGKGPLRKHWSRMVGAKWFAIPVVSLLVALIGILAPIIWKTPTVSVEQADQSEQPFSHPVLSPLAGRTGQGMHDKKSVQEANEKDRTSTQSLTTYRSMWPFSPVEKKKSCESLARLQNEKHGKKAPDRCSFYAPWIAYLSLETSPTSACELEAVFGTATEAITRRNLCGCGYAFLSAYYSYKRVLDRSRSFLEQALQLSPKDPWVRLVEGTVYERDLRDSEKAVRVLSDLLRDEPSFFLAQYHLAKIYITREAYAKAHSLFLALGKAFPQQQGFMRVEQSLASIEDVPYYSQERAKGLLNISRALSDLMDYPLAGQICRKVLDEMAGTLPKAEKRSAFYDLGRISEITGDNETAFTCYQNALQIDPFFRDARERMGNILKGKAKTS